MWAHLLNPTTVTEHKTHKIKPKGGKKVFSHYSIEENLISKHLSIKSWQQKKKTFPDTKWKQYLNVILAPEQTEWSYESWDVESATLIYNSSNCPGFPSSKNNMEAGHQPSISGSYNVSQGCNDVMERNGVADREPHPKAHLCHNPLMGLGAFHHRCGEGLRNLDDLRALLDREHCYMYLYCQA